MWTLCRVQAGQGRKRPKAEKALGPSWAPLKDPTSHPQAVNLEAREDLAGHRAGEGWGLLPSRWSKRRLAEGR